jgi:hypothetical protein
MKKLKNTIQILKARIHRYDGKEDKHDTRPTQSIEADSEIENLIKDLPNKSVDELRKLWKSYCNEEAPNWNKSYFIPRLSYRIQEVHYATELRPKVKTALEEICKGINKIPTKSKLRKEGKFKIKIGTVLERNYHGITYRVVKTNKGYLFEDKLYQYLSAIASRITKKSQTKGYEFFGLI